jgi:hypothetical protein
MKAVHSFETSGTSHLLTQSHPADRHPADRHSADRYPADRHPQAHCRENIGTRGLINTHPFIYARERETRTVEYRLGKV